MAFDRILGHLRVRELLARALAQGRVPPALLLTGPEGIGKRTLALEVGLALLCRAAGTEACEKCSSCGRIRRAIESLPQRRTEATRGEEPEGFNHRLHPDLVLIEPSPASIKIEQVRAIVKELGSRPFEGPGRAVIVDDAHLMTEQGMNTLLKSLEEPPLGTHFFLVTSSPETLLLTIRSRCQMLRLSGIPTRLIESHLRDRRGREPDEARLIASIAEGSLGFALSFDSGSYRGLRESWLELLERGGTLERMAVAQSMAEGDDPALALTALRSLLRDVVSLRAGADPGTLLNRDMVPRLQVLAKGPIGGCASELADRADEARRAIDRNANRLLSFDLLLDAFV